MKDGENKWIFNLVFQKKIFKIINSVIQMWHTT